MEEKTRKEKLVREVLEDFENRRNARKSLETKWLLNINFMLGNQHSHISPSGDVVDYGKQYYWQEREVFNHIAPLIEARLAKFTRVNCSVVVRPASAEDKDIDVAKLATKLVEVTQQDNDFVKLSNLANYWAELTGTAFYKVVWSQSVGRKIGKNATGFVREGAPKIVVCPPYEIYPDTLGAGDVDSCHSIIHARAYPVEFIEENWGVKVEGGDVSVISMDTTDTGESQGMSRSYRVYSDTKSEHAIVIEKYEMPTKEYPNGRLIIIAGDVLVYEGELPYINKADGKRGFPFVRQVSLPQPTCFYGMSVIERLIPVQRAYNAIKNRKHEFINRLSCGVIAVEDGSIDVESLEDEGLSPGKVITYRQGATPPHLMSTGTVPTEFRDEEDRLLAEFQSISGISNMINVSSSALSSVSGYALSLILEQDYSRLSVTTESIRSAVKEVCKMLLRLYRQFASHSRFLKISGENGEPEVLHFKGSELTSDDIVMESNSEMVETPATRKNMVLELLKYGLLGDENGKITNRNRAKILEMLGFGNWEASRAKDEVHIKKATLENIDMLDKKRVELEEVDDHDIHVEEHARYLVSGRDSLSEDSKKLLAEHIREHKVMKRLTLEADRRANLQ